jgi:ABC-2 type transport system permease protein
VNGVRIAAAVARREWTRFLARPVRIAATVGTPAIFLVALGSGFAGALGGLSEGGYTGFLLPGVIAMAALFAAVFGAFSLIEDRDHGPFRVVLAGPAPAWAVGLGLAIGVGGLGAAQSVLLVPAAALTGLAPGLLGYMLALAAIVPMSVGAAGIALALAWRSPDAHSFHGLLNLLFLPAWMLSGAFYPAESAGVLMRTATLLNPLAWPVGVLRWSLTGASSLPGPLWLWWTLTLAFATIGVAAAAVAMKSPGRRSSL